MPVFVSADSVLHAWHFSYAHMLSELEETQLAPVLSSVLDGMAAKLLPRFRLDSQGPLRLSLQDADYFLAVGRSLFTGSQVASSFGSGPAVTRTLTRFGITSNT